MRKLKSELILKLLMSTVFALFAFSACASQPAKISHGAAGHAHGAEHGHDHSKTAEHEKKGHACGACQTGMAGGTAWCGGCKVGYVEGKVVKCEACYKGKIGEAVWCSKCKKGFVNKEGIKCESCFKQKTGGEPCTKCSES